MQNEVIAMADLAVVSLSKWPAAGLTLGGAILGSVKQVELARCVAAIHGHVLSADAAHTLLQQLPSMPDRIANASRKAREIKQRLLGHPEVAAVRLAEDPYFGSECGGQLVIELKDASIGNALEQIVGFNTYSDVLTLPQLACTFGAAVSTIEHFASNTRHREGVALDRRATGEALIPENFVRVSIGTGPANELGSGLALALGLARDRHAYAPHRPHQP
jgi:cystathionine beta-lyase/cystathionine gamma-synthase